MYLPAAFAVTDLARLHDFIAQHSFGLLVSQANGGPFASHLPFLLDRTAGPQGTLIGHVARANTQWQEANGQTVLALFSGPHTYISPTWYEADHVVPTWNYTAVHAFGRLETIEDEDALLKIVQDLVRVHEQFQPRPWSFDGSTTFVKRQLAQIVGFRIEIQRMEGKFKLNQNHPIERRRKVVRALQQRTDENAVAVAALMQAMLPAED